MKKLFFAFMIAAAGLLASCNQTGGPNEDPKPQEKPFYGFNMDGADITAIGDDQFIIQTYTLDGNSPTRLFSAQIVVPGVDVNVADVLLPEGTYELVEGFAGDNHYEGSYYDNYIAATPYTALINEGTLEIKHTAKGYRITIWADGENAEDGKLIEDIECRYEGNAKVYTNNYPTVNGYGIFLGQYTETANCWVFEASVSSDYYFDIYLLTALDKTFADGIPSGKYPVAMTGEAGTALPTYQTNQGLAGSMMVYQEGDSAYVYDYVIAGEANVINNGDGTYEFSLEYYNGFSLPYVMTYSGEVKHVDYSEQGGGGGSSDL